MQSHGTWYGAYVPVPGTGKQVHFRSNSVKITLK